GGMGGGTGGRGGGRRGGARALDAAPPRRLVELPGPRLRLPGRLRQVRVDLHEDGLPGSRGRRCEDRGGHVIRDGGAVHRLLVLRRPRVSALPDRLAALFFLEPACFVFAPACFYLAPAGVIFFFPLAALRFLVPA